MKFQGLICFDCEDCGRRHKDGGQLYSGRGGKESYLYEGIDRMTGRKVVVITKQKLSTYLNNNGVASHTEVESVKGIVITVPSTYTVFSVVPIKNK